MWGDEQVLCLCSMLWQIGLTVVSAEKFKQIKFRHKSTLERADGVLVMYLGQHYVPARKYSSFVPPDGCILQPDGCSLCPDGCISPPYLSLFIVIAPRQLYICIHCLSSIIVLYFYIVSVYLYSLISCHPVAPSLLYHFIPICVFCECFSLAFASSIVSVSSLIQALSSILYIAFMVQHV